MRPNQGLIRAAFFVFTVGIASAQQMPKADVPDVPALGAGLCVSNLFLSDMVVQRDKLKRLCAPAAWRLRRGRSVSAGPKTGRTGQISPPCEGLPTGLGRRYA